MRYRPSVLCRRSATSLVLGFVMLIALLAVAPPAVAQGSSGQSGAPRIAASARQQIHAILRDKTTLTPAQRKLETRLLLEVRRYRQDPALALLPPVATGLAPDGGQLVVDLRAKVTPELLEAVEEAGAAVLAAFPRWQSVRARVPLGRLESLAAHPAIRQIRPADERMLHGNTVISEGDVAHRADVARANFGVDGSGVMVCAMSDSVDALAALQASGELPAGLFVLAGQSGNPGTSEGTALLEIIHDLAPGATLGFATGSGGTAQMAQNILDLAAAGCDVIVDDVFYFVEPPFQDGIIAQAVEQVVAQGVLYVSSAGNSGRFNAGTSGVWEGFFSAAATIPGPLVGAVLEVHDFGAALAGEVTGNQVTEQPLNDAGFFTLWWSDPLGGAGNDYDLFLLDDALANVVAFSAFVQDGDDDPIEAINSLGINHSGNRLVIAKFSGEDRFVQLNTHRGRLEIGTDGQITGHAGAAGAIAVAAASVLTAGGGPFTGGAANPVQPFSSDGPRRIFFEADGTPVPAAREAVGDGGNQSFVTRPKPDVTAADSVTTTTPGFMNFTGTSASAPHISAIIALIRQRRPNLSLAELQSELANFALDIELPGFDSDSGFGILDAQNSVEPPTLVFADGFESGNTSAWTDEVQ